MVNRSARAVDPMRGIGLGPVRPGYIRAVPAALSAAVMFLTRCGVGA